jgi:hypothetical protein
VEWEKNSLLLFTLEKNVYLISVEWFFVCKSHTLSSFINYSWSSSKLYNFYYAIYFYLFEVNSSWYERSFNLVNEQKHNTRAHIIVFLPISANYQYITNITLARLVLQSYNFSAIVDKIKLQVMRLDMKIQLNWIECAGVRYFNYLKENSFRINWS